MRRRGVLALLCVALIGAACSSTTSTEERTSSSGPERTDAASATDAADGSRTAGSGEGARSSGTVTGGAASGAGGTGGSGPKVAGPASLRGLTGRGVTADEIRIGVFVSKNLQNAFLVVGLGGAGNPTQTNNEERFMNDVIIKHLNERGGIAGRKIVPVYYEYDATNSDGSWSAQAQAGCSHFTEDNEVFAVIAGTVGGNDALLGCLAKKGVPLIAQHHWPYDDTYYSANRGLLFQPSRMRPERWAPAYIDGLQANGFFRGGKIGLMRFDAPPFERMADTMKRRLASHGLKLTDEAAFDTPQGLGDFGVLGSQISNAILSFRSNGVDRIIFAEYAGIIPFFYVTTAENQGYRARLGFSTVDIPATVNGQASPEQMAGAMAVSWIPGFDVAGAQDTRKTPSILECKQMFKDAGFEIWSGLYMGSGCESWFFLRSVVPKLTAFTTGAFGTAIEGLGTSFDSPFALRTRFGPSRHDGGDAWRLARYQPKCDCMTYEGNLHTVP